MTTNEASKQVARYYHVWRETNRIYSDWAKKHDISYNALLILYSLWNAKHYCTQKMICDQWMLPKQTVNTILKEFEKKSWYSSVPLLTTTENAASVSPMPALHTHKTSFQSSWNWRHRRWKKWGKTGRTP